MTLSKLLRTRSLSVAAALTLIGLFAWAWGSAPINLRERIFPKNLGEVEGGWLYRSGQIKSNLIEGTLRDLEIDLIVDLTHDLGDGDTAQRAEHDAASKLGIEIRNFPMNGSGVGSVDSYVGAISAIANAGREGKHVLVHCRAGDRRTGGVIAAYQLLVKGESATVAQSELERFHPDRGNESKVKRFLDANLEEIGRRLIAAGVIARLPDPMPTLAAL